MIYTKQQLIEAYCRATGYDQETHGTKQEYIQKMKPMADEIASNQRAELQKRLDAMPQNGLQRMKNVALSQLAKEEAEKIVADNANVEL